MGTEREQERMEGITELYRNVYPSFVLAGEDRPLKSQNYLVWLIEILIVVMDGTAKTEFQ